MSPLALRRLFCRRLLARREELGWSQSELARRSKVPQQVISRLEAGKNSPNLDTVALLAEALGLGVEELVVAN